MKILQLCRKFPYPLKDGEALAVTYIAKAFTELGAEVSLLAMNTSKHWFDLAHLPHDFDHYSGIHTVHVDNRVRPWPAFLNLFSSRSYHVERFDTPEFSQQLKTILEQEHFDVVQLESLYLTPYIPVIRKYSKAIIALRAHNVEHEIWERIAMNSGFLKKWYLQQITPRLRKYEVQHLNEYDLVIGISERDLKQFQDLGLKKNATVVPIGLDARDYQPNPASFNRALSLSFIGSLDWMPNQEGLRWFLEQVWQPVLAPAFPALEFHIAGRTAPVWLQQLQMERVHFHGEVDSAADFINQHSVMVVPLLSGSGMRAKILEAMALGKVVLSSTLGIEGIDIRHKKECLIADTPQAYLEALKWCYQQGPALCDMGEKALHVFQYKYDNLAVARDLLETYADLVSGGGVAV
jgi:glycosyltransferase involved in cell wall biosynthesis